MKGKAKRIYVAGHRGMVGAAIVRSLKARGYTNILTRTHEELDLVSQSQVHEFFGREEIDEIYLAAARVGGIHANNTYPAEFIYQNLMMEANVIHEAFLTGVQRILFLGSSCIYPRVAEQPISEECLMSGPLELTNEPYAIAKIAGIKLCESYNRQHGTDYRSVMPTNLYGPGDNYHAENSHVIPALMRRIYEANTNGTDKVVIWGSGTPRREFLYVDDMADACVHVMELDKVTYCANTTPRQSHLNVGTGQDMTIKELAEMMKEIIGYKGDLVFDASKPDGTPRKLLNVTKLSSLGYFPKTDLRTGLKRTFEAFKATNEALITTLAYAK